MKTVKNACKLQENALDIHVGDQIEQLDEIIRETNGREYFTKTHITAGMEELVRRSISRLAAKSNDTVFHLKQAMGGGKTHLMVGLGLLAKDQKLRSELIGEVPHQAAFQQAKVVAFNGRNRPKNYLWGEIARQLGDQEAFKDFQSGVTAPDEEAWLKLFSGDQPVLILLDEMPPYFHYYSTQALGDGTIADVITAGFACMLTAAQKKKNVCIVVSDLEAAYDTGGRLIQRALADATQELGRAEINITPVNLESNEIYEILRKRLFQELPDQAEINEIASVYAERLAEAAKAKTIERSAEALTEEIAATYPFHPRFKNLVALFKENEKFKQTRGLMELVSRLLKSVWESPDDVYLIGAQHFDLSLAPVREKLAEISSMRDVISRDLWDSSKSAHAQVIDLAAGSNYAQQCGALLLTSSLATTVNSVRGLTEAEMLECLIDPNHKASDYRGAFAELQKSAWYLHQTQEGRHYFDHSENLTKKLQGYADKAPQNRVDDLIRARLNEMYAPTTREAYEKVLPLPEIDDADAALKSSRCLLIISPDGKVPPEVVTRFFNGLVNKNNALVLTGEKSSMASLDKAARHVYAVTKADNEIGPSHPHRRDLDEKKAQYEQDFQSTVLALFDKLLFPGHQAGKDMLRSKVLDSTYPSSDPYNGERQVIKTLTADPIKLYTDIPANFDALRARAESELFGAQEDARKTDLIDKMRQSTAMPWLPSKGLDLLLQEAYKRGVWEELGNGIITRKPKPKSTQVTVMEEGYPDDQGNVRLKINTVNAGNSPRIHYQEDGKVSESSPVLDDTTLTTHALRVQFLAVDPTGKNQTGSPTTWTNRLVIRNQLNESARTVELFVAPKGEIRYTLDGSEPRNGTPYTQAIPIGKEAVTMQVFASCDGLEEKKSFRFSAQNSDELILKVNEPAELYNEKPKRLDNAGRTHTAIRIAKEKGIEFEKVVLSLGSAPRVIQLALGDIRVSGDFIEKELEHLQSLLNPDAPLTMTFKKAYTATGLDLQLFAKELNIELVNEDIHQE
ncbi:MAG: DUF499 domain-containing protein [Verrucomicrobia bacterium]|nr:DUF499 domain-containing protein [Verrucomicrobiota bacterium]MCH8510581.1 DUF499 domain-containing protein [Kiritimatiellia bacterium]